MTIAQHRIDKVSGSRKETNQNYIQSIELNILNGVAVCRRHRRAAVRLIIAKGGCSDGWLADWVEAHERRGRTSGMTIHRGLGAVVNYFTTIPDSWDSDAMHRTVVLDVPMSSIITGKFSPLNQPQSTCQSAAGFIFH